MDIGGFESGFWFGLVYMHEKDASQAWILGVIVYVVLLLFPFK